MTDEPTTTDETVTELLRRQHDQVRSLFKKMEAATGATRVETFDTLRAMLAVHETAEEEVVYPVVRTMGDSAERAVKARLKEEDEAKKVLFQLEKLGPDGDGFAEMFSEFKGAVETHAEAEEREIFPLLESEKDKEHRRKMAEALKLAEKFAPTHAHPNAPESGIGNIVVGPVVAIVDRVRDAIKEHAKS